MNETIPLRPRRRLHGTPVPFLLAGLLALPPAATALDIQALIERRLAGESDDAQRLSTQDVGETLDNSIDPDKYFVGGGDGFHIAIKDLPSQDYAPVVQSDGNLFIPEFGPLELGRIPLSQAVVRIQNHVMSSLKGKYKVYVTLSRAKTANISLEGAAPNPGTYRLSGTLRILDLLKQANRGVVPRLDVYDLRRVTVRNRDSIRTLDLLLAITGKDPDQNPYVYPGDRVELRMLERTLYVVGEILDPVRGQIPLVPGENAGSVLSMLSYKGSADTAYVLLSQGGKPPRRIPWEEARGVALMDNDVLTIPSREDYARMDTVVVSGEVKRPGTYPIVRGSTTAAEVLEMAGGPTGMANIRRGFVVRSSAVFFQPPDASPQSQAARITELSQFSSTSVRPEISTGLNHLANSNDYALIEFRGRPETIPLENGDEVRVPPREHYVYVSGSVKNPGAYAYKDGEDLDHYVGMAGGYSQLADRPNTVVVSRFKNFTRIKAGVQPEEGDMIMVPASVENKRLAMIYLPLVQTMASVLSVVLSFYILFQ